MSEVIVEAGSRIHLGLIDFEGILGRFYGGLGVYLEKPSLKILLSKNDDVSVAGSGRHSFKGVATKFLSQHKIAGGVEITVLEDSSAHFGLGSGTQTALTVCEGLSRLYDVKTTVEENAVHHGRGRISAVGTHLFKHGGFVLEAGHKKESETLSPLLARYDFPENWGFLIIIPEESEGLSGTVESEALKKTKGKKTNAQEISHTILMEMLPALVEEDLESFGRAISQVDKITGKYFSIIQGGEYRGRKTLKIKEYLKKEGVNGFGQSSWGPAVYGLTTFDEGQSLVEKTKNFLSKENINADVFYSKPRNRGAIVCG